MKLASWFVVLGVVMLVGCDKSDDKSSSDMSMASASATAPMMGTASSMAPAPMMAASATMGSMNASPDAGMQNGTMAPAMGTSSAGMMANPHGMAGHLTAPKGSGSGHM